MTIQDLGSIGELVGAVATVATLLYLAFQIRQNSHPLHTSIVQADRHANVELSRVLAGDSVAARTMKIGLSDPSSLTDEEQIQFNALMALSFAAMEQSQQLGSLKDRAVREWIEQPSVRAHWEEFGEIYSDALGARIHAIIENQPGAGPTMSTDSACPQEPNAMNWDAIGAIAETLGAVGVIASLVYLATQIRHSREQMRAATNQQLHESIGESWRQEYNQERPHGALNQITPAAYAAGVGQERKEAA